LLAARIEREEEDDVLAAIALAPETLNERSVVRESGSESSLPPPEELEHDINRVTAKPRPSNAGKGNFFRIEHSTIRSSYFIEKYFFTSNITPIFK